MKKNYIVKSLLILTTVTGLISCQSKKPDRNSAHQHGTGNPGHLERDTSLAHLVKPVNESVIAAIPVIKAQKGAKIYVREIQGRVTYDTRNQVNLASRVAGRIEKLYIKYNYQPVKRGQLILELYSPDLAAAQRELLLIQRSGNENHLLDAAKKRLLFLGMNMAQIHQVLKTGRISYRIPVYSDATGYILEKEAENPAQAPAPSASPSTEMDAMGSGNNTAVDQSANARAASAVLIREGQYLSAGQSIFTIYQTGSLVAEFSLTPQAAAQLSKNAKVIIQSTAGSGKSFTGKIGLIQPVFNTGENFVLARVYLKDSSLLEGELLKGQLPFLTNKGYWLPKEAVLSLGNQFIVFKKEGKIFVPKRIKTGIVQNDQIQVVDEIWDWEIAKNAHYLIDSESFIKTEDKEG